MMSIGASKRPSLRQNFVAFSWIVGVMKENDIGLSSV